LVEEVAIEGYAALDLVGCLGTVLVSYLICVITISLRCEGCRCGGPLTS